MNLLMNLVSIVLVESSNPILNKIGYKLQTKFFSLKIHAYLINKG
jgi:hypothetical protein